MLKSVIHAIKRIFLAIAGGLGGIIVGSLISLMLFHLRIAHSIEINSFGLKVFLAFVVSFIAGIIAPRFFMMFFLIPLSWLMNPDVSGGGHPSGDFDVTMPDFLFNASYMVGLALFVFGAIFSFTWLVGVGLSGILVFSIGVLRFYIRTKGEQAVTPNA